MKITATATLPELNDAYTYLNSMADSGGEERAQIMKYHQGREPN